MTELNETEKNKAKASKLVVNDFVSPQDGSSTSWMNPRSVSGLGSLEFEDIQNSAILALRRMARRRSCLRPF